MHTLKNIICFIKIKCMNKAKTNDFCFWSFGQEINFCFVPSKSHTHTILIGIPRELLIGA